MPSSRETENENWAKNGEYVGQSLLTRAADGNCGEKFCEPQTNKQNNTSHIIDGRISNSQPKSKSHI